MAEWAKSYEDLSLTRRPDRYDLIWLGSVFTHLPGLRWKAPLDFLAGVTDPGGVVVFTSHGGPAIRHLESWTLKRNPNLIPPQDFERMKVEVGQSGFAFVPTRPETFKSMKARRIDVSEDEYGFSFAAEPWVRAQLAAHPEWRFVAYVEGAGATITTRLQSNVVEACPGGPASPCSRLLDVDPLAGAQRLQKGVGQSTRNDESGTTT